MISSSLACGPGLPDPEVADVPASDPGGMDRSVVEPPLQQPAVVFLVTHAQQTVGVLTVAVVLLAALIPPAQEESGPVLSAHAVPPPLQET